MKGYYSHQSLICIYQRTPKQPKYYASLPEEQATQDRCVSYQFQSYGEGSGKYCWHERMGRQEEFGEFS